MNIDYKVDRVTQFGQYTAAVCVNRKEKSTTITLYEGEPEVKLFFFSLSMEPIDEVTISSSSDVHAAIKAMITKWEQPLYQQARAQTAASTLRIDHAEAIKRERLLMKLEAEEEKEEFKAILKDYMHGEFLLDDDGTHKIDEKKKTNYNPKSKENLVQFRNKKAK